MTESPTDQSGTVASRPVRPILVWLAFVLVVVPLWIFTTRPGHIETLWRTYGVRQFLLNVAITVIAAALAYVGAASSARRRRILRVALWTWVTVICVLILEVPALVLGFDYRRVFGAPPGTTWLAMSHGVNARDPELLHIHHPHSTFEGRVAGNLAWLGFPDAPEHAVSLRYDRNGFRNETDLERAPIVAIGDSFVEAAIVPLESTVTQRLAREFGVDVANLGQAAYGFQQEAAVLQRFAVQLEPSIVLWFVFEGNDFRDVEAYERARARPDELFTPPPFRERSFFRNALFALSRATSPEPSGPTPAALRQSATFRTTDGASERVYFHDYGRDSQVISPRAWAVCTQTLLDAQDRTDAMDARLVVVLIPTKLRVYRDRISLPEGSSIATWKLGDAPERLARWCIEREIAYLDLTPHLKEIVDVGRHAYYVDDTHWNEVGHAVAARAVADLLKARGWRPTTTR